MPQARIDDTLTMHYERDDYTDPWTSPETILLIHGVADTSKAWFAWVPRLARQFRLIRPDLRGFGQSSIPPPDYEWSLSGLAADLKGLLDHLGLTSNQQASVGCEADRMSRIHFITTRHKGKPFQVKKPTHEFNEITKMIIRDKTVFGICKNRIRRKKYFIII